MTEGAPHSELPPARLEQVIEAGLTLFDDAQEVTGDKFGPFDLLVLSHMVSFSQKGPRNFFENLIIERERKSDDSDQEPGIIITTEVQTSNEASDHVTRVIDHYPLREGEASFREVWEGRLDDITGTISGEPVHSVHKPLDERPGIMRNLLDTIARVQESYDPNQEEIQEDS